MIDLPKSIRVGYRDYAVEAWSPAAASAADRLGECDRFNGVIRVRADRPAQCVAETLLHEVLHAAYDAGDIDDGDGEEKTVTVLSQQLMQVFRDNPDLISFINGVNGNG